MAEVFPFRGFRYNAEKVGKLANVVTQPYDKIGPELQDKYYTTHEKSIVRVIKGKKEASDNETNNEYTRARDFIAASIADGTLAQEDKPAIYAYYQEYPVAGGRKTRKGFVAMGKVLDYNEGGAKPHEKTLSGPKADRLNLLRATKSNFGQIFMLYSDEALTVNKILDEAARNAPDAEAVLDDERHVVWTITDPEKIKIIQDSMKDKGIFIADGHHRYETAINFRNEMREAGVKCEGTESPENRMMTFVNMDDEGLTVFPTHRLIFNVKDFDSKKFEAQLGDIFIVREFPYETSNEEKVRREFLEDLNVEGMSETTLGLCMAGESRYILLSLKERGLAAKLITEDRPAEWKNLDVNVLHILVLEKMLGIGPKELEAQSNVHYRRNLNTSIDLAKKGEYQMAFLMNPTKVSQVKAVAAAGEKMPQKSTDFYPKLLTGMVFAKLNI